MLSWKNENGEEVIDYDEYFHRSRNVTREANYDSQGGVTAFSGDGKGMGNAGHCLAQFI